MKGHLTLLRAPELEPHFTQVTPLGGVVLPLCRRCSWHILIPTNRDCLSSEPIYQDLYIYQTTPQDVTQGQSFKQNTASLNSVLSFSLNDLQKNPVCTILEVVFDNLCIYPNPPQQVECDTRLIFKWNKTGLNPEFSFS